MYKVVLLRHGESAWNKENRFTGWTDVDLSQKGIEEAIGAGKIMNEQGVEMGRPSKILMSGEVSGGKYIIKIGGTCAYAGRGSFTI